jgi:hypothetical protein
MNFISRLGRKILKNGAILKIFRARLKAYLSIVLVVLAVLLRIGQLYLEIKLMLLN